MPHSVITYCQDESFTIIKPIDLNMIAWSTQKFNFDNSPIDEISIALERYLNKEIIFPQGSQNIRYTGAFNNPSDSEVATIIALAMGWNYEISTTEIKFSIKKDVINQP